MLVSSAWTKLVALVVAVQLIGCTAERFELRAGSTLAEIDASARVLEVHTRLGDVYVLERWSVDRTGTAVQGWGQHEGPDRRMLEKPQMYRVALNDIALYETNTSTTVPTAWAGVAVVFVVIGVVVVAAVANGLSDFKKNFCICDRSR